MRWPVARRRRSHHRHTPIVQFPPRLPDLSTRHEVDEWMDDPAVAEAHLQQTLKDLQRINLVLGGYGATDSVLDPVFKRKRHVRLLDLGCGGGDYLAHLTHRAAQYDCSLDAIGLDLNPTVVGHARARLDRALPPTLRTQVQVRVGDALATSLPSNSVDVAHAALFLHHLHGEQPLRLLKEMNRVAQHGLVVNDLHRHLIAYVGIWAFSRVAGMSPMVQHDGPISVLRGFRRPELNTLVDAASLGSIRIRWHWAFRWTLSTIPK